MDRERQSNLEFINDVTKATKRINNSRFIHMEDLGDKVFEVEMQKASININLPVQLGFFVLSYAKLKMLQFYYDVIDRFISREDFELMEMDTGEAIIR